MPKDMDKRRHPELETRPEPQKPDSKITWKKEAMNKKVVRVKERRRKMMDKYKWKNGRRIKKKTRTAKPL